MNARDFFAALPIPIIQAPMVGAEPADGGGGGRAGGLGSLAAGGRYALEAIEPQARAFRAESTAALAVNLFVLRRRVPFSGETVRTAIDRLAPWYAELGEPPPDPPNDFAPDFEAQFAALVRAAPPAASFTFGRLESRAGRRPAWRRENR